MYASSNLPRSDVSNGALAGALVGLLMMVLTGNYDLALGGSLATVVIQFLVSYLLPAYKVEANGLAGALVTLAVALYSVSASLPYDQGVVQTAVTFLVTFLLTAFLPPRQP